MKKVSCVFTIFGDVLSLEQFQCVVLSLKKQRGVSVEIFLCEQNAKPIPAIKSFCLRHSVHHIYLPLIGNDCENLYSMGMMKNECIKASTGEYLYIGDLDVLLLNDNVFTDMLNLCQSSNQAALIRQHCYRLMNNTTQKFIDDYKNNAVISYNSHHGIFVDYNSSSKSLEKTKQVEKYALFHNMQHVAIVSDEFPPLKSDYLLTFHCGGLFAHRKSIESIGGYCCHYRNWGVEDVDIQWKLNSTCGVISMDGFNGLKSFLHFEHPIRKNTSVYANNRKIFELRKKAGVSTAIKEDLENY